MINTKSAETAESGYSIKGRRVNMNKKIKAKKLSVAIAMLAGGAGLVSVSTFAEEIKSNRVQLEEVIVTAEKREQSLQEVPMAISAFTSDMLQERGIDNVENLQHSVPSFHVGYDGESVVQTITVRGVGTVNKDPGGDPGVPLHIDGHYVQSPGFILRDFHDVDRVEVQRGPQGTLYGRNAIGGNVNIITKRPTEEFEGLLGIELGNYNRQALQGVLSGPLSDRLRGRLVFADEDRDGYVKNTSGPDLADSDFTSARAKLELDLTDNILVTMSGYYDDDNSLVVPRLVESNYEDLEVTYDAPFIGKNDTKGGSVDLVWNLDSIEFRSLTAYSENELKWTQDADDGLVENPPGYAEREAQYDTFSQELQLLSKGDGPIKWVLGMFYYKEESTAKYKGHFPIVPINYIVGPNPLDAESIAGFGQVNYSLRDEIELIAGLRYTRDKKEMTRSITITGATFFDDNNAPIISASSAKDDENWAVWTGKLGINWYTTEDVMLYAFWSRGYKAGGYNFGDQFDAYDPEFVDAWEVGLKSEWLENRLQANFAAFYYDYSDKQEITRTPVFGGNFINTTVNAAAVTSVGMEMELLARPTEDLSLNMSVSWLESEYDEFITDDPSLPGDILQDLSGNSSPRLPEWKFSAGAQYTWNLNELGSLTLRGDYSWIDKIEVDPFNRPGQSISDYDRINASLGWENADSSWSVRVYVKNIQDEVTIVDKNRGDRPLVGILPPRMYGLAVKYHFW